MAQYVYTMRRVGKTVPPKRAILKDISLSFFPGAKIGVLGLNGAGKSSLLRIMAGEDTQFDGEAEPMPNMRIGFLPQEPELDPGKTVRETVEEGLGEVAEAKRKLDAIFHINTDIVGLNAAPPLLKHRAVLHGTPIFVQDKSLQRAFELRVLQEYEDFAYHLKKSYEIIAKHTKQRTLGKPLISSLTSKYLKRYVAS